MVLKALWKQLLVHKKKVFAKRSVKNMLWVTLLSQLNSKSFGITALCK